MGRVGAIVLQPISSCCNLGKVLVCLFRPDCHGIPKVGDLLVVGNVIFWYLVQYVHPFDVVGLEQSFEFIFP